MSPIKAFMTKRGTAAGMTMPEIALEAKSKAIEKKPVTPQVEPSYSYGLPSFVGAGVGKGGAPQEFTHEEVEESPAEKTPANKTRDLTSHLSEKIAAGEMPKDNPALKKIVEAFDGKPAEPARMKQAQEALEVAVVNRARAIVAEGTDPRGTFDKLVDLYDSQPNLNVRTSTSIENQAYSTPAPLAYLADKLAGVNELTTLYEPTAGNGMLTIAADPKNVRVNELNPERAEALREQKFHETTSYDAAEAWDKAMQVTLGKSYDAVVTNPPFGSVKDKHGIPTKERVDGYKIGQIDHLIAARALDAMKDNGKATLILGANKFTPGAQGTDDNIFLNWLYSHYNVAGHFEVEGKLYGRQGAAWPVRVIAIDGRSASSAIAPKPETIERARTWDDVYKQADKIMAARASQPARERGADNSLQRQPATEPRVVRDASAGAVGGTDRGESRPSAGSSNQQPGTPTRPVPDRNAGRTGGVASADPSVRPDADIARSDQLEQGHKPPTEPERTADAGRDKSSPPAISPRANDFQTPYTPASGKKDANVLIPVNMKSPLEQAMNRLEDEVGNLDNYVAKELGYDSVNDLHDAFMGLQVDSVAAAIHQIQQGKAIVIADQTGIGKGRQAAAIIRWAAKNGNIPVFITKAPSLFTDMYGDLADIGTDDVNPFIVNSDEWITRPDGSRAFANKPGHKRTLEQIRNTGTLPEGRNAVFLTYSQVNVPNTQQQMLRRLAPRSVFILDESHNAGGSSNTGDYLRSVLADAKGVTYLSATYAKRPDNMPLYFKTDMGEAIGDSGTLVQAMRDGGLPLQTVVSNNLVKAGQMFRRERSYDGISIKTKVDTANRAAHTKIADGATSALRAIVDADHAFHTTYVNEAQKAAEKENKAKKIVGGGNQAGQSVHHTEFSSVVHNFVRQMLLGIKADTAADDAIASIKRGEKPIIAVDNTMGSFLSAYVGDKGIRDGEPLTDFDYRTVLSRALERTRALQITNAQGDTHRHNVSLEELDPATRRAFDDAQKTIDKLKIGLPVSPIDWIRQKIEDAGYSVAEITGRNLSVDYSDPEQPKLSHVPTQEQNDKVETTRRFNDGRLDSLILNVAGSTGISLHASEKFKDQKPRHMIVAQPAQDINIFMQMLGRSNRTGQIKRPSYEILNADLPAEKRPTALLSKKMKSLNANTSSNTESATSVKAEDMLNKYGDQIVGNYLGDNPQLASMLDVQPLNDDGSPTEGIARKATGRLAILPVKVQEAFYNEVEQQYHDYITYLDSTNQNELEPKTFDYDAKETRGDELVAATKPESPFGEAATYGEYSIKSQGKPLSPEEVTATIKEHLDGKTSEQHTDALIGKLDGELDRYRQTLNRESAYSDRLDLESATALQKAESTAQIARAFIRDHEIGSTWRVEINGDIYNAAVANIRSTHKGTGNPYSFSKINVTLATNGSLRTLSVPATQLQRIEVTKLYDKPEDIFRGRQTETRETAKIITGNLLAAYGELTDTRGTIINFTKADGTTEQGILLPKKFDFSKNTKGDYRLRDAAHALKFLKASTNPRIEDMGIASRDGNVRVVNNAGKLEVVTPKAKARGGKYFLDHAITDLTGDFVSQQNTMRAPIPKGKATQVIDQIMRKSALYASPSMADEAKSFGPKEAATPKKPEKPESLLTGESGSLNPSLRSAKSVYANFINRIIDKNLDLGDKYKRVAEHDPAIATMLKEKDNAPRYFYEKALSNVEQTIKGLNESQVRLAAMMADSESREYLEANHPEQFEAAQNDPAVMSAVAKFKQHQDELAQLRIALGWHVRRDLSMLENEDGEWTVIDRDGNEVENFGKSQKDAQEYVEEVGQVLDHLKRTYPEHKREPLMGTTNESPSLGASYGGIKAPRPDKKQRIATAEYFYEHGAKDFSGYVKSYTQAYHAALNQKIYDSLTEEATKWKEGTAQPPQIEYRGKTYYSPEVAKSMKLAKPEHRPKQIPEYAAYDPAKDDKVMIRDFENGWSTTTTGRPGISPLDRYLAPKDVVDALEHYDMTRGVKENDSIRRFFQDQIVGLFGPNIHVLNIMRRLSHVVGSGPWDPRVWPYYQKLFFSKELRERMADGLHDDAIDALSKWGSYTNTKDIGSLHEYFLGNLNPANWVRQTIGKFSKGVLFDPKFLGGFGGLDQKSRVLAYDFLKDQAGMSEEEASKDVEDGFGNYNKANWTERMKRWARALLFPGWDFSSLKWFLRHPIKTAFLPALVTMAANLALNKAGKNRDSDKYDFSYLHYGDRKYRTSLVTESMALHLAEPILEAGKSALEGGDVRDIAQAAGQGVLRGGGGLAGNLLPEIQAAAELLANRQYMGGEKEIWRPEDRNIPGKVLPTRMLDKMLAFSVVKSLPAVNRFLDASYSNVDFGTGAGSIVGLTNYKSGAEERLKANEAKAMGYSQTLSTLAAKEPEAAEKFVQDPAKAPYLLFNKDFSELAGDLKKLDTEMERVKIAEMPYADRKRALEDLRTSRTQLLQSADALDDELTNAKLQMKKAVNQ